MITFHEFWVCIFFPGRGILVDMVTPVAVGIAGMEVVKAQLTQTSNLFTGSLRAYFEFLTKKFTSIGEWIVEFDPLNGTYVATFRSTNVPIDISMF